MAAFTRRVASVTALSEKILSQSVKDHIAKLRPSFEQLASQCVGVAGCFFA
jgi:hypothetical protein